MGRGYSLSKNKMFSFHFIFSFIFCLQNLYCEITNLCKMGPWFHLCMNIVYDRKYVMCPMRHLVNYNFFRWEIYPNSKVHKAYMGPTWGRDEPCYQGTNAPVLGGYPTNSHVSWPIGLSHAYLKLHTACGFLFTKQTENNVSCISPNVKPHRSFSVFNMDQK